MICKLIISSFLPSPHNTFQRAPQLLVYLSAPAAALWTQWGSNLSFSHFYLHLYHRARATEILTNLGWVNALEFTKLHETDKPHTRTKQQKWVSLKVTWASSSGASSQTTFRLCFPAQSQKGLWDLPRWHTQGQSRWNFLAKLCLSQFLLSCSKKF